MKRQTCFVWKSRLYLPHQVFTWFHFHLIPPWISSPAGSFQSGDLSVSESFHKILFIHLTGAFFYPNRRCQTSNQQTCKCNENKGKQVLLYQI